MCIFVTLKNQNQFYKPSKFHKHGTGLRLTVQTNRQQQHTVACSDVQWCKVQQCWNKFCAVRKRAADAAEAALNVQIVKCCWPQFFSRFDSAVTPPSTSAPQSSSPAPQHVGISTATQSSPPGVSPWQMPHLLSSLMWQLLYFPPHIGFSTKKTNALFFLY